MDYGKIVGIDKPVSRIVLGTDRLRGRRLPWVRDNRRENRAFALLDHAFELGCNSFDTARAYGDSERTLGSWMRKRRNRDDVVVISKGCHPDGSGRPRMRAAEVSHDLHRSLGALGADHIDVYLLHYDAPAARLEPVLERLNRHVAEGKIAAIGASNFSHQRIEDANNAAAALGLRPFAASSVQFSLVEWTRPPWPNAVTIAGDDQRDARDFYAAHDMPVLIWSSLARGFFSDPRTEFASAYFGTDENNRRLDRARRIARLHDVSVAQVALAYVLSHPFNGFAIVGCATREKLAQDVGALSVRLDEAALRYLVAGTPDQSGC